VRHYSLKSKLTLIAMASSTVALLVIAIGFVGYDLASFRSLLENDLVSQAEIIGRNCTAAVSFEDQAAAGEALAALSVRPDIRTAAIYLPDGRLLADYVRPGEARPILDSRVIAPGARMDWGGLTVSRSIVFGGERLATLQISSDLSQWRDRMRRHTILVVLLLIIAGGVALVFSTRLQKLVSHPILHLEQTMRQVRSTGDYSLRALKSTSDEVGALIDGFNEMLAEIQARDAQLKRLNETLEERVAERSAAAEQRAVELARVGEALRGQTRLLESILRGMADGVVVWDAEGRSVMANAAAEQILGESLARAPLEEWRRSGRLFRPDGITPYPAEDLPLSRALAGRSVDSDEMHLAGEAGGRWLAVSARPIRQDGGQRSSAVAVFRDVTEQRLAGEALRESEERYALAVRGANDGLWDWNLRTGALYLSPRWKAMLGYGESEIGCAPNDWFDLIHAEDFPRVESELTSHLDGRTALFECEHQMRHKDGHYIWVLSRGLVYRDASGLPVRMAGSLTDIAAGRVSDLLTGLPNRVLFMDRIGRALERVKRRRSSNVAVLFIDLDRFKLVNDSLGHVAGDELLVAVARRIERCLRSTDSLSRLATDPTVARMGGDEFTILLEDIRDVTDATRVAERITRSLAEPFDVAHSEVFVTASVGIAVNASDRDSPEELLRSADTAMYRAKSRGRARYEVFDTDMRDRVIARLQLETDLRRAVDHSELSVHYQPIASLESGDVVGFEALVRWDHPDRGMIMPGEFISLAEETGLIIPLGQWVLHEACRQMSAWQRRFGDDAPQNVSVNMSSKQFLQRDLLEQIHRVVASTHIDPSRLKLEITESLIMEDPESAARLLAKLREMEVKTSIDDFGTGYSSLSYLHRFPINTLKVDRSFVGVMGRGEEDAEIVRTIVTLAHNLGLDVVAEGVETVEQRRHLTRLRCEYGQGSLFSVPLPAAEAETLFADKLRAGGV
jgi:diguanylate cyclase (GGDEF)-like protein/PAS domain S-box-containing protein